MAKITVKDELILKQETIENATAFFVEQTKDWQLIKRFLTNRSSEITLTQTQKNKLERYQFVYNQNVLGRYTTSQIVEMMCSQFNIKTTQAYEDVRATKEIFTSVININRLFEITVQLDINRQMIAEARAMQDYKSASALERNRKDLLALLPEKEENPSELFTGHTIEAIFDPRLIGAPDIDLKEVLKVINEKRDIKLNIDQITSIPFDEISNNEDATAL